ncbi:hypothetical protein E2C01_086306 [Portunus trituberculatus]|uniref:Uncharacterized protein n=1 Tax=Portunus trituberculatus TaxID=210409 RepID=A0A5B7J529_PORTR|nr:hypothetical protein [Portunus trituberculatus]
MGPAPSRPPKLPGELCAALVEGPSLYQQLRLPW